MIHALTLQFALSLSVVWPNIAPVGWQTDCNAAPVIREQPATDAIDAILAGLHLAVGPTEPDTYRPDAGLVVEAGPDGNVTDVSLIRSTGNMPLDKAIVVWAKGVKFAENGCSNAPKYYVRLDVDLEH